MPPLQSSDYNRRIEIWRDSTSSDGAGGSLTTPTRLVGRWASAKPLPRTVTADVADVHFKMPSWRIELRWYDVQIGDRVLLGGKSYIVRNAFDPDGFRLTMVLMVEEIGAQS
jgi:hypothetical protein